MSSRHSRGTPAQEHARFRALEAVSRMRGQGLSLSAAASASGTTPTTVRRYASPALQRSGRRYVATPSDRLRRRMRVLSVEGPVDVDIRGSRVASTVGAHWNAISDYLRTGDARPLARYRGKRAGGVELASDPDDIERRAARYDLDVDDIYPDR